MSECVPRSGMYTPSSYPNDIGEQAELLTVNIQEPATIQAFETELENKKLSLITQQNGDGYILLINGSDLTEILKKFPFGVTVSRQQSESVGKTIADGVKDDLLRATVDKAFNSAGIE